MSDTDEQVAVNPTPGESQATPPADSASAENNKPEVVEQPVDTGERSADDLKPADDKKPKSDAPKEDDKDKEKDPLEGDDPKQPQGKAEQRKEQLKQEIEEGKEKLGINPQTEIRDLVSARNAIREKVQEKNSEVYHAATVDELLTEINPDTNELYTATEAKVAAMEQKQELDTYTNSVAEKQLTLSTEAQKALSDFGMFNPDNKEEYDKELAEGVDNMLHDVLVFDKNTKQVIDSHISPYRLYKTVHDAVKKGIEKGTIQGQKNTEKMLASADNAGSSQGGDPSFKNMSHAEKREYLRKKGHDV